MKHLSRMSLQSPAHQKHLATGIDAGQQAVFAQTMTQRLRADREALSASHLLGHFITGRRFQE